MMARVLKVVNCNCTKKITTNLKCICILQDSKNNVPMPVYFVSNSRCHSNLSQCNINNIPIYLHKY